MIQLTGKSLVAGIWQAIEPQGQFHPFEPATNTCLPERITNAGPGDLAMACDAADASSFSFAETTPKIRARLLRTIAEQILSLGDTLIEATSRETGLPEARLIGERGRTVTQLNAFAELLEAPKEATVIDEADPNRTPVPKPGTRLEYLALGPVAVFGASNFPYAFSVAGGDTASALAAGCPVVVKGHPAHPLTSELVASAISTALELCGLPQGIFSLLQSDQAELSHALVKHPAIKAVGFTGSLAVAKVLQASIHTREEVIPFYGELGSVNPQVILADKLTETGPKLAESLVQSLLMGHGQFCTSPGLWLVPASAQNFLEQACEAIQQQSSAPMLTSGIRNAFYKGNDRLANKATVSSLALGQLQHDFHTPASLYRVAATDFIQDCELQEEIFGPVALVVTYDNEAQLLECIRSLNGQLTASVHGSDSDLRRHSDCIRTLAYKVGRLIFNQMPTGVEICHSMNHGGPYPASTDSRTTSVGTQAIKRFQRPICYQNRPDGLFD